jgi:hypothetical protein
LPIILVPFELYDGICWIIYRIDIPE